MTDINQLVEREIPEIESCDTVTIVDAHLGSGIVSTFSGISTDGSIGIQVFGFNEAKGAENYALTIADLPVLIAEWRAQKAEIDFLRPEVMAFAKLMEKSLRAKDAAYGVNSWKKNDQPDELLPHVMDRAERALDEANLAKRHHPKDEYDFTADMALTDCAEQAVHAANYAMMTADVCGALDAELPPRKALETD